MVRLKEILSRVLDIAEDDITDQTSPETVDTWDSLNALLMVTEIEGAFKVKLTMDEVQSVTSVKDIRDLLSHHGVALDE